MEISQGKNKPSKKWLRNLLNKLGFCKQKDVVHLSLYGLEITLSRKLNIDTPHEITIVVPRAEIRERPADPGSKDWTYEVILNSITISHSPRHGDEKNKTK